jgi:hypothetical protein
MRGNEPMVFLKGLGMNKLATVSALAALAMGGQAMAADFSYNFFDGNVILADAPGNDGVGIGVAGSHELANLYPNATAIGGVRYIDFDGFNLLNAEAGLGFHWPLVDVLDLNGGVSLLLARASGYGDSDSDLGFTVNAGVRAVPFGPEWEFDGGLKHVDSDFNDDTYLYVGARYMFRTGMSAGLQLESGDIDTLTLSVRWEM